MKRIAVFFVAGAILLTALGRGAQPGPTGPGTEKRFPPLQIPAGFRATLFACDPLIEYPSAIALGPRAGTLFVAVDYLTGLGIEIVRRDEIRLAQDTDGDGYADRAPVFADGFNSIQGLTYHDGAVYVMHAPLLTALRDTDGDGKADERRDLAAGLGLPPEKNPPRLHCANGLVMGHDGWLYLALGDHGCDVKRPEGDRLVLHGGGILRCRPDGRDLHIFATGLRNIYDLALDAELSVFVRDNENDGGDYKIRVCHSFFGADHGYPYHYYERPDEALTPLADLGLGSSAGGVCYLETQFPPEYRGNLFFCEWGKSLVRYPLDRAGSAFAPVKEHSFAEAAANDPYGFKPTDVVVDRDGSLLVADWGDGQRPKRGRGRIYRIQHGAVASPALPARPAAQDWSARLNSSSHHERIDAQTALQRSGKASAVVRDALKQGRLERQGRLHALWILALADGKQAAEDLFTLAHHDGDVGVRAQAVRALADVFDPVLLSHRPDAGRGDQAIAARLAALGDAKEPRVLLEIVVALGRLRWTEAPRWLAEVLRQPDAALTHAGMQTLRRCDRWSDVLTLIDRPASDPVQAIALRAVADQAAPAIVDGLLARLRATSEASRRREYVDALARVAHKPGSWVYWGYRPGPRPAPTVAWERTEAITQALNRTLADRSVEVRTFTLTRMLRERIATDVAALGAWLDEETDAKRLEAILGALREHPPATTRTLLARVVKSGSKPQQVRIAALSAFAADKDASLVQLTQSLEDGPVLAAGLRALGRRGTTPETEKLVVVKLASSVASVRAAALETLVSLGIDKARVSAMVAAMVTTHLQDSDAAVRRAAAAASGTLGLATASERLLLLVRDPDADVRRASLDALRLLKTAQAAPLAVAALEDNVTHLAALELLADLGKSEQVDAVVRHARRQPTIEVVPRAVRLLSRLQTSKPDWLATIGELQGASGLLVYWHDSGPISAAAANGLRAAPEWAAPYKGRLGGGFDGRVTVAAGASADPGAVRYLTAEATVADAGPVQFLAGASAPFKVWLNGQQIHERAQAKALQPESERFAGTLVNGVNRVGVELPNPNAAAEFHLAFRRISAKVEHEALMQAALAKPGNAERGRKVLLDVKKSQCLKCHRLGDDGERIGPELTGVGSRFARVYLIESILEPNRTIAPSYHSVVIGLKSGKVLTGVKLADGPTTLTIADQKGDKHVVPKADIDEQRPSPQSVMPEGLERQLTAEEFVDLIAFLAGQKGR